MKSSRLTPSASSRSYALGDAQQQLDQPALLAVEALWLLASVAIACSTRLGQLSTLLVLFGAFILGLSSDLSFIPNLQLHWMSDALSLDVAISPAYLAMVSGYTALFICAILCLASILFEGRETG